MAFRSLFSGFSFSSPAPTFTFTAIPIVSTTLTSNFAPTTAQSPSPTEMVVDELSTSNAATNSTNATPNEQGADEHQSVDSGDPVHELTYTLVEAELTSLVEPGLATDAATEPATATTPDLITSQTNTAAEMFEADLAGIGGGLSGPTPSSGDRNFNVITGTDGSDLLVGTDGEDHLRGLAGNDTLVGGASDDVLDGGEGADVLNGGSGFDTASYRNATSGVSVNLDTGRGGRGEADGDEFISIEGVYGSEYDDVLRGDDNGKSYFELYGFGGDDTIHGGLGNGDIYGGDGDDIITASAKGRFAHGDEGDDTMYAVEGGASLFGDAGDDLLIGSAGADRLDGGDDDDTILGGAGDDSMSGGDGNDLLVGGAGDDHIEAGAGVDEIIGGLGSDTVAYYSSDEGIDIDLTLGRGTSGDAAGDTYRSIENVTGSGGDDRLSGDENWNKLVGLKGDDRLVGGAGNDRLSGGDGADTLFGGQDDDTLFGGSGDDILRGDDGRDVLDGGFSDDEYYTDPGTGNDILYGGGGADLFVFKDYNDGELPAETDTIKDFEINLDQIDLREVELIKDFDDLRDRADQVGNNVVIDTGDNIIIIENIDQDDLTEDNFVFDTIMTGDDPVGSEVESVDDTVREQPTYEYFATSEAIPTLEAATNNQMITQLSTYDMMV